MIYFQRSGVRFFIPLVRNGIYELDLYEQRIRSSLNDMQALKDRSPLLDQMSFERRGAYKMSSVFGIDQIILEPLISQVGKGRKLTLDKRISRMLPAIEVFDYAGDFKGVAVCESGTFEPPYTFYGLGANALDPFFWGNWRIYYATRPFAERIEKMLISTRMDTGEQVKTISIFDIPNTAENLAGWNDDGGNTDTQAAYTDQDPEPYCWMHPDALCSSGNNCEAVREDYYYYDITRTWTYQDFFSLLDEDWDPISGPLAGTAGDWSELNVGENCYTDHPAAFAHFCTHGDSTATPCPGCVAAVMAAPANPPPDVEDLPVIGNTFWYFWDVYTTEEKLHAPSAWVAESWTNYEDEQYGGMVMARENSYQYRHSVRTNGADEITEEEVAQVYPNTQYSYGVTTGNTITDTNSWQEGAVVDGTFYEHRAGSGEYDEPDVPDMFEWENIHPRYWRIYGGASIFFMSAARRIDQHGYAYFHVNSLEHAFQGTEFDYSHTSGGDEYHTLPGLENLYGKGHFRLVRIDEEFKPDISVHEAA